jgi:hypothetical protein
MFYVTLFSNTNGGISVIKTSLSFTRLCVADINHNIIYCNVDKLSFFSQYIYDFYLWILVFGLGLSVVYIFKFVIN